MSAISLMLVLAIQSPKTDYDSAAAAALRNDREASVKRLQAAFESGYGKPCDILKDERFKGLFDDPAMRRTVFGLLERHAKESEVTIVRPSEPGERLTFRVQIVDDGKPVPGAIVGWSQTDSVGRYNLENPQGGRGANNPRLAAWFKADAEGRFVVHTVFPGSYQGTGGPSHCHFSIDAKGRRMISEFLFDDHNFHDRIRRGAAEMGWPVVKAVKSEGQLWVDWKLEFK